VLSPYLLGDVLVTSESQVSRLTFESFGVRVSIESDRAALLTKANSIAEKALLGNLLFIENAASDPGYRFGMFKEGDKLRLFQNGEWTNDAATEFSFFKFYNSMLRITVAENAVNTVFVHAGVVGWKGKAVIFPGRSFRGKTTLVAELIQQGAVYYSDEYAVIGTDGLVRPFPRDLSLRDLLSADFEKDISPQSLGAEIGTVPLSVGAVIITEFDSDAEWQPAELSVGNGILETIPHTIPIRIGPEMSLKILNLAFKNAIFAKSVRGDVKRDASAILAFLDKHLI
jgi:hypothetical protein